MAFVEVAETRPNILFIVTDDQRRDTLRPTDPSTGEPWMAKTLRWFTGMNDSDGNPVGTEFTKSFTTTPICCASRASIMTGRYSHNHRVYTNDLKDNLDQSTTLQHYLESQPMPYYTGIFGKYLNWWVTLGGDNPPQDPPDFHEWAIFDNGAYYPTFPSPPCPDPPNQLGVNCVNAGNTATGGKLGQLPAGTYATTYVADQAVNFISERASDPATPWFLFVSPMAPHSDLGGAFPSEPKYQGISVPPVVRNESNKPDVDVTDKPPNVQDEAARRQAFLRSDPTTWPRAGLPCGSVSADGEQGYSECVFNVRDETLRMLKSVDDLVDRIFTTLEETNQADNTLAFFTSDEGFLWMEHGLVRKTGPYLEAVQVPLLMRWPGHVITRFDSSLVGNIDLAPTALAAARIPIPATVDGQDLLAPGRRPRARLLVERFARRGPWFSTITPDLRYTEHYLGVGDESWNMTPQLWTADHPTRADSPPGTPVREYYDLLADPLELSNVLHDGDVSNDPPAAALPNGTLPAQLTRDRKCAGHGGVSGRPACP